MPDFRVAYWPSRVATVVHNGIVVQLALREVLKNAPLALSISIFFNRPILTRALGRTLNGCIMNFVSPSSSIWKAFL